MNNVSRKHDLSLVAELVCCLLGSCAFCTALLPAMGQDAGMLDCLLYAAVDLSLIFLLSRRWWITPGLLALAALAGAVAVLFFHVWEPVKEYCLGFADWYSAAYPYTLPYSENGSLFLVHLAFSFPVTLLLYLFFRRFPFLPVWVLLSGALLTWMQVSGAKQMLAAAALLLIALLVLLAGTNARSINRKLGKEEKIPSASMQFTALLLAPLVVLFAFAFGPKTEGAWKSHGLVNLVEDMKDVFSFYGDGSYGEGSFDLGYSGLAPHGSTLGGDIDPNNRTVMRVKTSTPILLAGAVYDSYNGYGWYDTGASGRFRFSSPLWRGKRREVYCIGKPSSRKASEAYGKVTRMAGLEISLMGRLRSLFSGGKMEGITVPYGDVTDIYFNSQGELFTLELPDISMTYTIKTRVFSRERENFDENMRQLIRLAASSRDRDYEEIARRNTAVSDTVEPFVWELAGEITEGCGNDYDKALAIERWIGDNCTYTKTPGEPPYDRDFLSTFLETREGYCTYYATAMTILARMNGLPARYVTGYGLKQADRKPQTVNYIATNATAHAWTQIYFYGVGWVDFDPTEWEFYELVETDPPVIRDPKPVETPAAPEIPKLDIPEPEQEAEEGDAGAHETRKESKAGRIVLLILLADLAVFLVFLGVRSVLLVFKVENFYYRLIRRYPDNRTRADECYHRIIRQLGFLGLEMEPSDTILSFSARADGFLGSEPGHEPMEKACRPVLLSRFAMRKPTDGEVKRMCDFYIFLERELRQRLGIKNYILHRLILGR